MSELTFEQMLEESVKESARGRNDSTTREIYETVYNDVMKEVQENLSQMKPQLIQEVVDSAAKKVIDKYEQRFKQLEQKISNMERNFQGGDLKASTNKFNGNTSIKAARIDVSRIHNGFMFDGWIYYRNKNMGNFLYKVREDGSENTQLTNYSVIGCFKVSDGYLNFSDADCKNRKIKLG